MRRIMPVWALTLLAFILLAGCSKKPAKEMVPTTPQPKVEAPPVPPPPPPPPPPAPKVEEKPRLELQDAFFDYDKYNLRDDARAGLTEDGKALMQAAGTNLTIEGHCDERGTVDYNLALGEKRANAAKDFLVSYGISADRLRTISYGKGRPFALGHDEASWAQNRRAHFVVDNP